MSIGSNAAEFDDEFLFECFVHHPAVQRSIDPGHAGMILDGRTGAGKTAIVRYIINNNNHCHELEPLNMAMNYVANSDILNFLHTIGADLDLFFQTLWKHVLCIEYIRLRWDITDESSSRSIFDKLCDRFGGDPRKKKSLSYLKEWESKFWITMDQNIKELTEKMENKLEIELGGETHKIKSRGQYAKQLSTDKKSELISRARKVISADQLAELAGVIDILSDNDDGKSYYGGRNYYILIDKLDEHWVDTSIRLRLIRALIESLKAFRRISNLKLIVCMRSDILERVLQETKNLSFQREKYEDYFLRIEWNKALLTDLINKIIRTLFRKQYSPSTNLEFTDVFAYNVGSVDPMDYMLDRTLMRPRDIIAFVNQCLKVSDGTYEISAAKIKQAEKEYSRIRRDALEQEWLSAFPTLKRLLDFVASAKKESFSIDKLVEDKSAEKCALEIAADPKIDFDPIHAAAIAYIEGGGEPMVFVKEALSILYRVGAIGVKLRTNERISYSHLDEPSIAPSVIPDAARVRIHPMLHSALALSPI
ncbi:hypothetical protein [Methylobacterium sp. WL9]|uniref:P-loop ATPase, Sll1717 family n=1 Tax=Methylobacterium sp. WL9 TaxID=2603898 RepID=UPI001AEDA94C|nr:hypothetical protein [Methylobacterium sp. WL9]